MCSECRQTPCDRRCPNSREQTETYDVDDLLDLEELDQEERIRELKSVKEIF